MSIRRTSLLAIGATLAVTLHGLRPIAAGAVDAVDQGPAADEEPLDTLGVDERTLAQRLLEDAATPEVGQSLRACLRRRIGGRPALLDRAYDGGSLLETLATWPRERAGEGVEADEGVLPAALIAGLLRQCAEPGQITQGPDMHNTCTTASVQFMLARENPAELARLVRSLAVFGRARLRNGEWMTRVADSLTPDRFSRGADGKLHADPAGAVLDPRCGVDRLFQSALMDYANGADRYSNKEDLSHGASHAYTGLYAWQQARALAAVFGEAHAQVGGDEGLRAVERAALDGPIMTNLRWSDSSHAVVVERVEDGRVFFENPFGPWHGRDGAVLGNPPRRIEDRAGTESMSFGDFAELFQRVYLRTGEPPPARE